MLILRVRQAEVALADGRLDEAYQLVASHHLENHRRGQRLITRLVEALVRRGNEHLKAERFVEALADGEKASKLGGSLPDVVALRTAAADGVMNRQRSQERQQRMMAEARKQVEQGRLDAGSQLLSAVQEDVTRVQLLRRDIDNRRAMASSAVQRAQQAKDRGELHLAADQVIEARAAHPRDAEVDELATEIAAELRKQIRACIDDGHLHRTADLLSRLCRMDGESPTTREMANVIEQLGTAWRCIANNELGEARMSLARVAPLVPSAKWIKQVMENLEQAESAMMQVKTGPLAWLNGASVPVAQVAPARAQAAVPMVAKMQNNSMLPSRLMLHVDGVGSFLILRSPLVTIGPVSSTTSPDVGLIAEPTLTPIRIERRDEDYFIGTRLLASGQKLELSPRCRMTFAIPNPASTSAVLELSGAKLPRTDVRRVILMDQDVIIGPGSTAHVPAAYFQQPVVLHVRNGQFFAQAKDNRDAKSPLTLGENIKIGELSFVLTSASEDRR